MKHQVLRSLVALTLGAPLLALAGCSERDELDSESVATNSAAWVLSRTHQEFIDFDGMFVTYWERDYESGQAAMDSLINGYTTSVDNTSGPSDANFVVGKGRKPCWGETLDWQVNGTPSAKFVGVYGWLRMPLVEYYIGRLEGGSTTVGTYETSQGTYELQIKRKEQANILNPNNDAALIRKFLQFNLVSLDGVPSTVGPVDLSEHYRGWEELMTSWWPTRPPEFQDWSWYRLAGPDYCVVSTEVYGQTVGYSDISEITIGEYIEATPNNQVVSASGTSSPIRVEVTSTEPWTIEPTSIPEWISVTPTSSAFAGLVSFKVTVGANSSSTERFATLRVRTNGTGKVAEVDISQFHAEQGYVAPGGGGQYDFLVTRNGAWTAQSSAPAWLSITPSSGNSGTYGMFLSASANTGSSPRSASVTITGGGETKTVTVSQAPVSLLASPTGIEVAASGETRSFDISSNVVWWSVYTTNGSGWLTLDSGSQSGAGNGTVSFTAAPNTTGQTRTATFTIEGGDVAAKTVFISQLSSSAPACDPSNRLTNPGFESGTTGWTTWGGALSTTGLPVRTGTKSGKLSSRTATWQGPVQDLIGKLSAGRTYRAKAWAKVSGFSSQPLAVTLKSQCVGGSPIYTPLASTTGTSSSWTELSGEFTTPSCPLTSLALYVEGPSVGTTLYVDDASVTEVCP